jgi:hypothetical protein
MQGSVMQMAGRKRIDMQSGVLLEFDMKSRKENKNQKI